MKSRYQCEYCWRLFDEERPAEQCEMEHELNASHYKVIAKSGLVNGDKYLIVEYNGSTPPRKVYFKELTRTEYYSEIPQ